MERALKDHEYVLIEATANQVNQYGGYTGMKPVDFRNLVFSLAEKIGFPSSKIILGGDHLGPLTWKDENSASAMEKAKELIQQYVLAGFTKIHIDTSMHLGDDDKDKKLNTEVIARRGAILCQAAELIKENALGTISPVYVVGSEVPTPGGSSIEEDKIQVTSVKDFKNTVEAFKDAFLSLNLNSACQNIVAVVVQPGVEFGDDIIHEYDRGVASELSQALKQYPELVFEGHSTDYQTDISLKHMVEDGIAILKVGPALTFALREALFALNHIENELLSSNPPELLSNFINTLDEVMVNNPQNWRNHYHGDAAKIKYARKYSFSDRARYYLAFSEVKKSAERLIQNLRTVDIPLSILDQYMPLQYKKIRKGLLVNDPEALLKDRITDYIDDYVYAITPDNI